MRDRLPVHEIPLEIDTITDAQTALAAQFEQRRGRVFTHGGEVVDIGTTNPAEVSVAPGIEFVIGDPTRLVARPAQAADEVEMSCVRSRSTARAATARSSAVKPKCQ